jgi:hypothetical protein
MSQTVRPILYGTLCVTGFVLFLQAPLTSRAIGILPAEAFDPDLSRKLPACGSCHDPMPNANGQVTVSVTPTLHSIDSGTQGSITARVTGGPNLGFGGLCMQTTRGSFVAGTNTRISATGDAITHVGQTMNSWTFGIRAFNNGLALLTTAAQSANLDIQPTGDSFGFWGPNSNIPGVALRLFFNAPFVNNLGTGCAGTDTHVPVLGSAASAAVGQNFNLELHGAPPASLAISFLGSSSTSFNGIPLPLDLGTAGAPGCFLRANMLVLMAALAAGTGSGGGSATMAWPVPNDPSLRGAVLYFQGIVVDAAANAAGLTTTNGLRVTIQ